MRRLARLLAQGILPGLVLFVAWTLTGALVGQSDNRDTSARSGPEEEVYAVAAQTVRLADNRATLRAFGEVIAAESAELRVASPGEVVDVAPDLAVGNAVEKGTPLVTIDPFTYERELSEVEAQLAEARARLREADARIAMEESALSRLEERRVLAERDLERANQLVGSGNITDKAVDDRRLVLSERRQQAEAREHMLEVERARRAQTRATVQRLESAVAQAERALENTVLTAPFDGIVRSETAAVGRRLAANDIAVSLIRAGALDVRFVLSDGQYGRLVEGDSLIGAELEVTWRIGDVPRSYSATITRVAADIARESGGVDVYARIDLPDEGVLPRPGAFVEVAVQGRLHEDSARVANTALYDGVVYVIGDDERLERREVSVLAMDGATVILAGALAGGEAVVTTRLAEAGEGVRVRRVDTSMKPREPNGLAADGSQSDAAAEPRAASETSGSGDSAAEPS